MIFTGDRRALLLAVKQQLVAAVDLGGLGPSTDTLNSSGPRLLDREECDLAPFAGRPPAFSGKRFIAVWSGPGRRTQPVNAGLDRTFAVNVTVTMRINEPLDRAGTDLAELAGKYGLDDLVDAVITCVHADSLDYRIIRKANLILRPGDPSAGGFDVADPASWVFNRPLQYLSDNGLTVVGSEWFWAEEDEPQAGVTCTIQFGEAERIASYLPGSLDEPPVSP